MHIRNPVEWSVDQLRLAGHAVASRHARGLELYCVSKPLLLWRPYQGINAGTARGDSRALAAGLYQDGAQFQAT